jgi:hypothetical protein
MVGTVLFPDENCKHKMTIQILDGLVLEWSLFEKLITWVDYSKKDLFALLTLGNSTLENMDTISKNIYKKIIFFMVFAKLLEQEKGVTSWQN